MDEDGRLVFSRAEYEARLRAVRREMATRGIDVLLVDDTEHLAYARARHGLPHVHRGARHGISETVLVNEAGAERLTRLGRRLFVR